MHTRALIVWGLTATVALGAVNTALAEKGTNWKADANVNIRVIERSDDRDSNNDRNRDRNDNNRNRDDRDNNRYDNDRQDNNRDRNDRNHDGWGDRDRDRGDRDHNDRDNDERSAFQIWFRFQTRDYDGIDQQTGRRIPDLLQVVTDVYGDSLVVVDQYNGRRVVRVTPRTQIVQAITTDRRDLPSYRSRYDTYPSVKLDRLLSPGDLIVIQGYQQRDGDYLATMIQRKGRIHGYGYDEDEYFDGRAWGEVHSVDFPFNRMIVNTSMGRKKLFLARTAAVIIDGRRGTVRNVHSGDRVVFYYDQANRDGDMLVTRLVVLPTDDRYPEGCHAHWADPNYRGGSHRTDTVIQGYVIRNTVGIYFNTLEIRLSTGSVRTVRYPRHLQATRRSGGHLAINDIRENAQVSINYNDIDGNCFADSIDVD